MLYNLKKTNSHCNVYNGEKNKIKKLKNKNQRCADDRCSSATECRFARSGIILRRESREYEAPYCIIYLLLSLYFCNDVVGFAGPVDRDVGESLLSHSYMV